MSLVDYSFGNFFQTGSLFQRLCANVEGCLDATLSQDVQYDGRVFPNIKNKVIFASSGLLHRRPVVKGQRDHSVFDAVVRYFTSVFPEDLSIDSARDHQQDYYKKA